MSVFKCTMLFNFTSLKGRPAGWSESFYLQQSTSAVALEMINSLANYRIGLLTASATLVGTRVTDMANTGLTEIRSRNMAGPYGVAGTDTPWQTLLLRVTSDTLARRSLMLRALPDQMIVSGDYSPSTAFRETLARFTNKLVNEQWRIRAQSKEQVPQDIAAIDGTGAVTMIEGFPGLTTANRVQFFRVKGDDGKPIKGFRFLSSVTDASHFVVRNWITGTTVSRGRMRVQQYGFPIITRVDTIGVRLRKVGAPFFASVGRRSRGG